MNNNEIYWLKEILPEVEELFNNKKEDIGFEHSIRIMNIARYIASIEQADKDMVSLLGLLSRLNLNEAISILALINKDNTFKENFIKNFNKLILGEETDIKEVQIVNDAINLEAMGAIGIIRYFYRGALENLPLKFLIKNFSEKISKIESKIKTQTGKNMAYERYKFILTFLNRLKGEIVWENI